MKALTIKQPWASLIMFGGKDIENRDWAAPRYLIGQRIAIHSSKKIDPEEIQDALDMIRGGDFDNPDSWKIINGVQACGVILGTVKLIGCVRDHDSPWFCGEYGFILEDPQPFDVPIPMRGQLGFWDWTRP